MQKTVNAALTSLMGRVLPSETELRRILRDEAGFGINDKDEIEIDVRKLVIDILNVTDYNFSVKHPVDVQRVAEHVPLVTKELHLEQLNNVLVKFPGSDLIAKDLSIAQLVDGEI